MKVMGEDIMNESLQVANIALTSRCNLSCKHCGAWKSNQEMSLESIISIIERLTCYGIKHIIFAEKIFLKY